MGLGWPTYFRIGNWRMFGLHSRGYQAIEQTEMEDALGRGEFFVAYLSSFPSLTLIMRCWFMRIVRPARTTMK